ncbi:MAG: alpha/beta hydrolase [Acidobacterium ailaaui]|nr:alpha/beta hydrolase [Pseudacidobacterium ailaaui]
MRAFRGCFALFLCMGMAGFMPAQEHVTAARADGQKTPLMVYRADIPAGTCAPLAVISHGAGGTEEGYTYLAKALEQNGWMVLVMGHRESGPQALRREIFSHGIHNGVEALVTDADAETRRLLDVGAALSWAEKQCRPPYRVLLGHSMGSSTVMLEAGARNRIGIPAPPAGQDRFDAYVALSPEGPGIVFPDQAWSSIHKPMLVLTGTRDQSLKGGPKSRQIPWQELPGTGRRGCQWMGVVDGATHMNFAGEGFGADRVTPLVNETVIQFLSEARSGNCPLPPQHAGMILRAK